MAQDFSVGIIGAGPAGSCCAYFIKELLNSSNITLINNSNIMQTILQTGGGRCNLAHGEFDYKELVKNYPRGEKFLYSVFSKFDTSDTIELFNQLGIDTYISDDGRIFPVSNSAKEVQQKFFSALQDIKFVKETALRIEKNNDKFKVITDRGAYTFNKLIYATGGHSGYDMIKRLGISIIPPTPSLVGLVTKENMSDIKGIVLKNIINKETGLSGDILFTHYGVSGPLIYKISSLKSKSDFPYTLTFNLLPSLLNFQSDLNNNPHKQIKNVLSEYIPLNMAEFILNSVNIKSDIKAHNIDGKMRDSILEKINQFKVCIKTTKKDGETVTAGGVDLNKINPKTMESKEVKGLYFCGEVIDVDGFCGGFNLQNCWSTAYVAAQAITENVV